jgi:hypothetical protein
MRLMILMMVSCAILFSSCDLREREQELAQRAAELNEKEQELLLKEKQLKEQELLIQQQQMDSTLLDSLNFPVDSSMLGTWAVRMRCTETTCPGSAVGDVKTETWEIIMQDRNLIAKVYDGKKLVRVYNGNFRQNGAMLKDHPDIPAADNTGNITVTLQPPKDNLVNGRREIIGVNQCKIIYDLELRKQQPAS